MKYYINQKDWEKIYSFLKNIPKLHTQNELKLRKFFEGIWYRARTGCQWRLLPMWYGDFRAIHKRFALWARKNIWQRLMFAMQDFVDLERIMLDSTVVRAHASAAGYQRGCGEQEGLGRSRGGFSTKVHALVDALGNPLKFFLTAGQRHDILKAKDLVGDITNTTAIADKSYDSNDFLQFLAQHSCEVVIPPRRNRRIQRTYDEHLYKERHLIECCFGKMKHFRNIATRFEKSSVTYLGFLYFVGTFIWLR